MNQEEFIQLAEKYYQGKCNQQEKALFEKTYQEFQQHSAIPALISRKEEKGQQIFTQIEKQIALQAQAKKHSRRFFLKVAAVAALLITGSWLWLFLNQDTNSPAKYKVVTTKYGQKSTVELPDGSTVVLNSGSQLKYREQFGQDERSVKLQGEAFFEVKPNTEKPFLVQTDSVITTVLGTSFNVNTYDNNSITVTVASGRVAVGRSDSNEPWAELIPNQQLTYLSAENQFRVEQVELAEWISWKDGRLDLADRDLAEVLPELERWYGITFVLENPALGKCQLQTELNNQSLQSLLEEFAFAADINYQIKQDTVFLQGTGCK